MFDSQEASLKAYVSKSVYDLKIRAYVFGILSGELERCELTRWFQKFQHSQEEGIH